MKLKTAIKFVLISSCAATTFQAIAVSLFAALSNSTEVIYLRDLYTIPAIGILSALPVLIFVRRESAPRWEWILRRVLHLLLTAGPIFTALWYFGWVSLENLWFTLSIFLSMYIVLSIISETRTKKLANQINARIRASHDSENASH